jgi:hypothetical protein
VDSGSARQIARRRDTLSLDVDFFFAVVALAFFAPFFAASFVAFFTAFFTGFFAAFFAAGLLDRRVAMAFKLARSARHGPAA